MYTAASKDIRVARHVNENAKAATELIMKNTSISVPVFVQDRYIQDIGPRRYFSVWNYIGGLALEALQVRTLRLGCIHGLRCLANNIDIE